MISKQKLGYDKNYLKKLAQEIDYNITLDMRANLEGGPERPRIQSNVVIQNGLIKEVTNRIIDIIVKECYDGEDFPYTLRNWLFIIDEKSPEGQDLHNHTRMQDLTTPGEWTFTYYVTMPNNLSKDDGYIYFKSKDYNKAILPKEDELLIFPANLMHLPKISPGSKTSRRVIAGTISKVKYKSNKTLM